MITGKHSGWSSLHYPERECALLGYPPRAIPSAPILVLPSPTAGYHKSLRVWSGLAIDMQPRGPYPAHHVLTFLPLLRLQEAATPPSCQKSSRIRILYLLQIFLPKGMGAALLAKACGWYLVCFPCSPTSID